MTPSEEQWRNLCAKVKRQRIALRQMNKALVGKENQIQLLVYDLLRVVKQLNEARKEK